MDPSEFKYKKPKRGRPKKMKEAPTTSQQSASAVGCSQEEEEEELEEPPTMVRPQAPPQG